VIRRVVFHPAAVRDLARLDRVVGLRRDDVFLLSRLSGAAGPRRPFSQQFVSAESITYVFDPATA
jgi:hypothetical protein